MDTDGPSDESSFQISTSQEQGGPSVPSRALHVKKSNTKSSPPRSASSGSSSSNRRPPTGQLVSHRGPGSTPNTPRISHVNSAQDVNAVDSSIEPVSLHQHLHTAYPKLLGRHVGLDPQQVHARETSIIAQANAAVHEARERVHVVENQAQQFAVHVHSEAQSVVQESQREAQQAQNEARSVEHRAYGLVEK